MLNRDKIVIIKPSKGSWGNGVLKISKLDNEKYEVHGGNQIKIFKGKKQLERYLSLIKRRRATLIQYCIPLATINGKPMNFRYVVQRKRGDNNWEITGKHGKIAQDGYFITNVQRGSHIVTVETALLRSNITNLKLEKIISDLDRLALRLAKYLTPRYKSQFIWGFDLAVDKKGKVWLIEANCGPQINAFYTLEDSSMIKKIESFLAYNSR